MRSDRYKEEPVVKKKKKQGMLKAMLILILILAAAIAGSVAYFYKTAYDSLSITFTEDSPVLEFGESAPSMSYVKESAGDIYPEYDSLDTESVGNKGMYGLKVFIWRSS